MKLSAPRPLGDIRMELGEGPCWAAAANQMWFVDILGKSLNTYDLSDGTYRRHPLPLMPGTVAPMADGRALLALSDGFYALDLATDSLEQLARIEREGVRFNDGKCSPDGRFFAGSMEHAEKNRIGAFYRMDTDGKVTTLLENIGISNGIAWRGDIMYYIDTFTHRVDAFDYDGATGAISNRRPVVTLENPEHGFPDGMCMDSQGRLYVAEWSGARVGIWSGSGDQLGHIDLPCKYVSACTFGSDGVLYITTARKDDTSEYAGCVFAVRTDACGEPAYVFGGI